MPRDMPWTPRSAQEKGIQAEKRLARKMGARLHPRSGAGRIKDDMSTEDQVIESKAVAKSHTLKGDYLDALYRRAIQQGKTATYVVTFEDSKITATITITRS